jgi:hypothetical protein
VFQRSIPWINYKEKKTRSDKVSVTGAKQGLLTRFIATEPIVAVCGLLPGKPDQDI